MMDERQGKFVISVLGEIIICCYQSSSLRVIRMSAYNIIYCSLSFELTRT